MDLTFIAPLAGLIALAALALGWLALRRDPDRPRGSRPGQGDHVLRSDYQSGMGGHSTEWRVPRDPQEYARKFVPHHAVGRDRQEKTK